MHEIPSHWWAPWKFIKTPNNWWQYTASLFKKGDIVAATALRGYLEDIQPKYGVQQLHEWESVILRKPEVFRLSYFGTMQEILAQLYPHHAWTPFPASPAIRTCHN